MLLAACSAETPQAAATPAAASAASAEETGAATGTFSAVDFDGEEVTEEIFAQADLTLVNVWATWCGPCISELPGLEAISRSNIPGFQVVGIVYDLYDPATGHVDASAFETAEYIEAELSLTYTNIIPDKTLYEGLLGSLQAFPTTFFVNSEGYLVGDPVVGSQTEASWEQIIGERLSESAA